jgi:hypothetical protein
MKELQPKTNCTLTNAVPWYAFYGTAYDDGLSDGTVTSNSATNGFSIMNRYAVKDSHNGLAENERVAGAIKGIIKNGAPDLNWNAEYAVPTSSEVYVDVGKGAKKQKFDAIFIGGNNYFKLRDVAYALGDKFNVVYNETDKTITLMKNEKYKPVGGEMTGSSVSSAFDAVPSGDTVYLNGKLLNITPYKYNNNNYVKLRGIAEALDFDVDYNTLTKAITIQKNEVYTDD